MVTPEVGVVSEAAVDPEVDGGPAGLGGAAGTAAEEVSDALPGSGSTAFAVRVAGFEGPFDLLLSLITRHRIELTELALHVVTDDFIAHVWHVAEADEFYGQARLDLFDVVSTVVDEGANFTPMRSADEG